MCSAPAAAVPGIPQSDPWGGGTDTDKFNFVRSASPSEDGSH